VWTDAHTDRQTDRQTPPKTIPGAHVKSPQYSFLKLTDLAYNATVQGVPKPQKYVAKFSENRQLLEFVTVLRNVLANTGPQLQMALDMPQNEIRKNGPSGGEILLPVSIFYKCHLSGTFLNMILQNFKKKLNARLSYMRFNFFSTYL